MKIGFTGTRNGMTEAQREIIRAWLDTLLIAAETLELHHGCCVGADAQAHALVREVQAHARRIGHPPTDTKLRAWLDCELMLNPRPYLERNHAIVDECELLVAAPAEPVEQLRSGTWATVRYARRVGKLGIVVLPDGTVQHFEGNMV